MGFDTCHGIKVSGSTFRECNSAISFLPPSIIKGKKIVQRAFFPLRVDFILEGLHFPVKPNGIYVIKIVPLCNGSKTWKYTHTP